MPLKDIKGEEKAVEILKRSVKQDRIPHAYLFLGPKGVGKKKTALEFSKLLNCQDGQDDACSRCPSCIKIEKLTHPDILVISKDKNSTQISIEKIRRLQHRLSLKPFEARYKIAIIADAEDMSEEASNCLLKILEEPTPDTLLILTASNQRGLPDTIISRCQVVRFRPLTTDEVNNILMKDFSIEEKEARFLSAISGANVTRALILKEKNALAWKNSIIDGFNLCQDSFKYDNTGIFSNEREIQVEAIDILLGFYRDLLIYKFMKKPDLIINIDRIDTISDLAERLDTEQIQVCIKDIEQAKTSIEANANTKLTISVLKERLAI